MFLSFFAGLVAASFNEGRSVYIPHRFVFVDNFRRAFPRAASFNYGFTQVKFAPAGYAPFSIKGVEFFKIYNKGLSFFI